MKFHNNKEMQISESFFYKIKNLYKLPIYGASGFVLGTTAGYLFGEHIAKSNDTVTALFTVLGVYTCTLAGNCLDDLIVNNLGPWG